MPFLWPNNIETGEDNDIEHTRYKNKEAITIILGFSEDFCDENLTMDIVKEKSVFKIIYNNI